MTVPPQHQVTVAPTGETFQVAPGERIHSAARRAGIWLPFECGWGSCGTCKATLVEGEVELLFPQAPAIDARDERRRRVLLCQTTASSDLVIKPPRAEPVPPPERPVNDLLGRLVDVELLGPAISRFTVAVSDLEGRPTTADYRPGQYAVLELAPGLRRCLSMAGLPGDDRVEFIAKHYPGGAGSDRLFALRPGDPLPLELPYGDMWLRDTPRPILLVAGGTGISAVLALMRQLRSDHAGRPVAVVYGAATEPELVCWDELTDTVASIPGARLHGVLLRPEPGWTGDTGLVTDPLPSLLDNLGGDPAAGVEVYLAGPPPMVRAVQDVLSAHQLQRDRIHVDSFG